MKDTLVDDWLRTVAAGLELPASKLLLCAALPRVAPEYTVVMIATAALLPVLDDEWHVHLERGFRGIANLKGRKCDLVLQSVRDPPISYYLEFKTVWPGSDEGIDGAHDDVLKLRNLPAGDHERAYIVLFAYALEKSPKEARYGSVGTLSELVEKAKRKLGAPGFTSDLLQLDELGARAQAQLLAWRVDSIVDQG